MASVPHVHACRKFYPGSCLSRGPIGWGGGGRLRRCAEREEIRPASHAFRWERAAGSAIRDSGLLFAGVLGRVQGLSGDCNIHTKSHCLLLLFPGNTHSPGICNFVLERSIRNRGSRAAEKSSKLPDIWGWDD